MGIKGDKGTGGSKLTTELLAEKFSPIGDITTKKMFGGSGVFHGGKMFCLVDSKGIGFLKVDDSNLSNFEKIGSVKHSKMPYFSIPDDLLNDSQKLIDFAKTSIEISK